jgi:hypothetical protein
MPHYIIVGGADQKRSTWRLPAEADLDALRSNVGRCMRDSNHAEITVEMRDDPRTRGTLIVNGNALPFAVVIELPEHGPMAPST